MRWRPRPALRLCATLAVALALAWGAGFVWFIQMAARHYPPPPSAEGIVALTGGADRVSTALRLLQAHKAHWLLLSGIGGGADLSDLARRGGMDPLTWAPHAQLAQHVQLGRRALSTRGNALETGTWVRRHDIRSLIVVTAFYHMPRALTELRRALPDVTLYPDPVLVPARGGIGRLVTLRFMALEYSKYLLSLTGVTAIMPGAETPASRA